MHYDGRARASRQDPSVDCFLYGRLVSSNCDRESACEVGKDREAAYVLLGLGASDAKSSCARKS